MLYIILIIIAIFVYLIYKKQNFPAISKQEAKENIQAEIDRKEEYLSDKMKKSILKDYMQTETTLFDCGRKNFIRLGERFKHDDSRFAQVVKDWIDYIDTLGDIIFEREMLDVCTSEESDEHYNKRDELVIKIQEIEKRFKNLLGDEYIDPNKFLNPQNLSPEELQRKEFKDLISEEHESRDKFIKP